MSNLKQYLDNVKEKSSMDSNAILNEAMKGSLMGTTIGGGVGLFIGYSRNQNLLLSFVIGSLIGGTLSVIFIKKT